MSEWHFLTLKEAELEFIDGDRGVNYPKKAELLPKGDCVFLNTGNVRQNSFDFSNLDFITKEKDNLLRNGKLQRDDIVLTTRGTVGNVALYSQVVPFSNIRINSGMVIIRVNKNFWHPYFVYLFFQSHLFKKQISRLISGSAQPQLPISILETVSIPRLTLDEQKEIIFNIKSIDQKIQINNQINQELEAMAKTLYDYWFVQFDFPDQNGKPYKSSGGKMVYNPELKRQIPEGWGVASLFDVAEVQYGYPFSTDYFNSTGDGVPVIRIRDILGNDITNYSTEEVEDKYKINVGDVLIGMDGNFHMNYWIQEDCYLNQRVVKVNSDKLPNMVLKYQIEPFIKLREKSVSRTTVGHLSDKDLKAINVILPKEKYLSSIFDKFESILENIIINQQQNQELTQLRDWLLPMLMNGQVKVENYTD